MSIILSTVGLVILVLAGDLLVRGAVNLSMRLGIPALIVSLTIVAIGTSAPELLISVSAVMDNVPGIAVGNVVGSNIANILLVVGVPAMLVGLAPTKGDIRVSYIQMMAGTAAFIAAAIFTPLDWRHGVILLGLYLIFMGHSVRSALLTKRRSAAPGDMETDEPEMAWWRIGLYLIAGIIGLPLGADILIENATFIAREFGVSDTVIGLTLVAIGTSLPELATTISAAFRRQSDVAIGNVIGSNMANLLGIMGAASFFGTIPVNQEILSFDIWIMAASSLLLVPLVFFKVGIGRIWGAGLVALYVIYIGAVLV